MTIETQDGDAVRIVEDEEAVWVEEAGRRDDLTRGGAVRLPRFEGHPQAPLLRWTVPDLGLKLVWVAPGVFRMGSNDGSSDGKPVHVVRISRGFWMGTYEVTQAEYEAVIGTNPSQLKGARNRVMS